MIEAPVKLTAIMRSTIVHENTVKTPNNVIRPAFRYLLASLALALAVTTGRAGPGDLSSWKPLAEGGADVEITRDGTVLAAGEANTNALHITVKQTGMRFGIVCPDMGPGKLKPDQWYDFTFSARTDTRKTFALTVSLESPDGGKICARTTLPEVGGTDWQNYSVALHVHKPASKYRMVIALADTGNLWLNNVSVTLRRPR